MIESEIRGFNSLGVEKEKIQSVGVGLIIVGMDLDKNGLNAVNPLIYFNQELKSNPATEKVAGQYSIPLERRTIEEMQQNNRLRAMAEFTDDRNLDYFRQHLYTVPESFHGGKGSLKGNPVDLTIIIFDGNLEIEFSPFSDDVRPVGWVSLEDYRKLKNVRPLADQLVNAAEREKLLYKAVVSWEYFPERRQFFIPNGYSVEASEIASNKKRDIIQ